MSTTSPSTPVWSESATIYAAIELSSTSWLLAIEAPDRKKLSRHQVPAGDCARLIGYLEQARARVHEQTDAPVDVITCYEAGRDGFWLHRVLQARGIHNQVVDAASLLTDRKKKSAKTDKIDVRKHPARPEALARGRPGGVPQRCTCPRRIRRTSAGPCARLSASRRSKPRT